MKPERFVRLVILALAIGAALSCASSGPRPQASNVVAPRVIHRVAPEYPEALRVDHVSGVVMIAGTVPKEGGVLRNPRVVRSDDLRLDRLALDAISHWTWAPGLQDGQPVDVEFTTQVSFSFK